MNRVDPVRLPVSLAVQNALSILMETAQTVGEEFFPQLVSGIAEALDVRWAFVCRFDPDNPREAATLANWDNGPADNFVYDLAGTPCADVATNKMCCFAGGVAELYPQDELLVEMGVQSYAGTPLRSADGRVLGLISVMDDKPFENSEVVEEILGLFSGRAAAELERLLTASLSERLGKIVEASVSEAYVFSGKTFQFELVNRGARENLGYSMEELRALTPWDLKPEYSREEFIAFVQPLIEGEVQVLKFETVHQRKDGSTYPVAVQLQFFPDAGDVFFASITDETERKEHQEREQLILHEMNHRAKNVLAVVQVLARQSARHSPDDYLPRFEARIAALAASHDVLVNNLWKDIPVEELVRSQLGHFTELIGNRIVLSGPAMSLKSSAAQNIGLALHELATNAAKYGALSNANGGVEISWSDQAGEDGERSFTLDWREHGGPEVRAPASRGFGSFMIEKSLGSQFGCKVDMKFDPAGVRCTFRMPVDRVLAM